MIVGMDDDSAAEIVADCARKHPHWTNDMVYQHCRLSSYPVSRRQVSVMMQVMRRERKEAMAEDDRNQQRSPEGEKG